MPGRLKSTPSAKREPNLAHLHHCTERLSKQSTKAHLLLGHSARQSPRQPLNMDIWGFSGSSQIPPEPPWSSSTPHLSSYSGYGHTFDATRVDPVECVVIHAIHTQSGSPFSIQRSSTASPYSLHRSSSGSPFSVFLDIFFGIPVFFTVEFIPEKLVRRAQHLRRR